MNRMNDRTNFKTTTGDTGPAKLRRRSFPRLLPRSRRRHDPMLVLNMAQFNFTDGWARAFARDQYGRFSV